MSAITIMATPRQIGWFLRAFMVFLLSDLRYFVFVRSWFQNIIEVFASFTPPVVSVVAGSSGALSARHSTVSSAFLAASEAIPGASSRVRYRVPHNNWRKRKSNLSSPPESMLARQRTAPYFSCHGLSSIVDSRRGLLPKSRPSAHVQVKVGGFDGRARNLPWRGCPLQRAQKASHQNVVRG